MRDQAKKPRGRAAKAPQNAPPATPDAAAPRGTPAITTALRKNVRQRRSGVPNAAAQQEELLPPELLQLVGGTLMAADLASASLVCRLWSRSLRGGVSSLTTHLLADAASNDAKARSLASALPHLARLHVNFGARCDAAAIAPFFSSLRKMQRLRELRITSWVPYAPQKGSAPLGCYAPLELGGITSLVIDGAALSANDMLSVINGAATATGLVSMSLLPNTWPYLTQLDPFQVPAWLQPAQPGTTFTGTPRMPSSSAATLLLCKLPNLGHLVIANEAGNQAGFFSELQRLSCLSSLDLLTGAPVQSKSLQILSSLTSLTELRLQPALNAASESLEEHALLGLTQLRRLGVRLARRPAEPLCRDLCALTRRRAPALIELELSKCVWSAEASACIAAMTSLTRLRLERLECVRPARASASASRAAMSVDLQPLMALRGMRCFEVVAATGSVAGVLQGIGKLWSAWAPTLEDVRLVDLSVAELDPWSTLPALGQCGALTSLRLLLREPMAPALGVIDIGSLPASLRQLALRHAVLTAGPATETRMKALESVSLRQCTVVRPDAEPQPLGAWGPETWWHAALLRALPALRSVELVGMPHLRDEDFAGIGALTALTSLLVCASGTIEVTHASLQAISGLTRLRQLRWHVGDVTDLLPDVAALKGLSSLVSLHLPSYLHGQFSRWSAYNALPPLCDVHVEMPLP
ncbi:hypothetical protein Rsub_05503 [Raphidocelis subcapitata]|uniref:F-box domain-containing protein n=1 Tax=Raphidocelis subcapitata TaxID=307507 RepID=A0A2V0NZ22_9CHLO|nr:hypothetical protein Rsub_05503 [Raphidocelis subcapitata]|eukprot:GBF92884.1 hypothetical protein Rsub_05503 [Raphidocelis subcapitata]